MNLERKFKICLIALLIVAQFNMVQILPSAEAFDLTEPSIYPVVYVYPNFTDVDVGETFTIAVIGFNFTNNYVKNPDNPAEYIWLGNLYGFDIEFTWDPNVIKYINHTATVPLEDYPAPNLPSPYQGALYEDIIKVADVVDEDGNIPEAYYPQARAKISYASMGALQGQNGNVTFFTMTFEVVAYGASALDILLCDLAAMPQTGKSVRIYRIVYDGVYRNPNTPEADFAYWPDAPVANKTVTFTASVTENKTNIANYTWNFGDDPTTTNTSSPLVNHTYTSRGDYNVGLKVKDTAGFESAWKNKTVTIIPYRDLEVYLITVPERIEFNASFPLEFNATIRNLGEANETCTTYAYFNATVVDTANPSAATWQLINQTSFNISKATAFGTNPTPKTVTFSVNTTTMQNNTYYYMLVNMTNSIPSGFERNLVDNSKLSDTAVYLTNMTIYELSITKIECLWKSGKIERQAPLIEGETATVRVTIKNKSTRPVTVNYTTFIDGVSVETVTESLDFNQEKLITVLTESIAAGMHSINVTAMAGDFATSISTSARIVKPPIVNVTYSPSSPIVNETITFNASATIHQDPDGTITSYTWEIYAPGVSWTEGSPIKQLSGTSITYNFTRPGNWTVVLKIKDSPFNLTYDKNRPGSEAYAKSQLINVLESEAPPEEGGGIPIEYIAAIVIVIVVAIVAAVYIIRKRKAAALTEKQPEET